MQQDAEELYSTVVNTLAQSLKEVGRRCGWMGGWVGGRIDLSSRSDRPQQHSFVSSYFGEYVFLLLLFSPLAAPTFGNERSVRTA